MKKLLTFLIAMSLPVLYAQKMVHKTFLNPHITNIQIDTKDCFKVDLATINGSEMSVEGVMEGEYMNNVLVQVKEEGNALLVSAGFQPSFLDPNDKLSAHKVVSIALKIRVPEHLQVLVYGTNANINVKGQYADLKVVLNDGNCTLFNVGENTAVTTQSGAIVLGVKKGLIKANTKYGVKQTENIPKGDAHFTLNSITGNINIRKIE
ncbi:hypothetical protein SAMN04487911_104160 [Arenibacter nanhaiticus]|uniref:Adhesin domain-containing protein n=1 Tax=Arenibacter nanhaiticus TaxID=558155 RepID=A0A1M6D4R7_9FLAO|nr:hypothetical protein [Arenibacter nanhaiticus]SHI68199.1 hypothetical protein SAMN04487911_104160 [Arenibacter nanhaiticus]